MQFLQFQLADFNTGAAIPNGKCFVYLAGTSTLATLYDVNGSSIANPAIASTLAQVGFAAADGTYDLQPAYPDGTSAGPKILGQQLMDTSGVERSISPGQYHAVLDGSTNDGPAFVNTIAGAALLAGSNLTGYGIALPRVSVPFLPHGANLSTSTITLGSSMLLAGQGGGTFGGAASMLMWSSGVHGIQADAGNNAIEGLALKGPWVFNSGSLSEGEYDAIKQHYKLSARDLFIENWQGDAFYSYITAGSGGDTEGNANSNYVERVSVLSCRCGFNLSGADTNAGVFSMIDCESCRWCGVLDNSFLGNTWIGPETAGCGVTGEPGLTRTCCYNNGHIFACIIGQEAGASTNSPPSTATSNTWWLYWKDAGAATAYAPQWTSGQTWRAGGPFLDQRLNGQTVTVNLYSEFDQPPVQTGQNTLHVGGQGTFGPNCRRIWASLNGVEIAPKLHTPSYLQEVTASSEFRISGYTAAVDVLATFETGNFSSTLSFTYSGSQYASIQASRSFGFINNVNTGLAHYFRINGADQLIIQTGQLVPGTDNSINLGSGALRWGTVYAGTGTINTSDERHKEEIASIDDALLDAWGEVDWQQFKFSEAVKAKGDGARLHIGLVAQRVRDTFEKHGLDGFKLGLLCHDKWSDEFEPVMEEVEVELVHGERNPAHMDAMSQHAEKLAKWREAGRPKDKKPKRPNVPEMLEVRRKGIEQRPAYGEDGKPVMRLKRAAGEQFGVRYEEALALEAAYQRRRVERLEQRLAKLEKR